MEKYHPLDMAYFVGMSSNGAVIKRSFEELVACRRWMPNMNWTIEPTITDAQARAVGHLRVLATEELCIPLAIPVGEIVTIRKLEAAQGIKRRRRKSGGAYITKEWLV